LLIQSWAFEPSIFKKEEAKSITSGALKLITLKSSLRAEKMRICRSKMAGADQCPQTKPSILRVGLRALICTPAFKPSKQVINTQYHETHISWNKYIMKHTYHETNI
jgi:hypothetical protein